MRIKKERYKYLEYSKKKPNVSVIIPTYNRASLIDRAIDSVLSQTFSDFELIIVDDGSTDNTADIVKNINDKRIKYIQCKENKGANVARNTGINIAQGIYIAFQDSDNEWFPNKLEKQIQSFKKSGPEVGVVYTGVLRIKKDVKTYIPADYVLNKEGDIHIDLLNTNFIDTPALLVKKTCFDKVGMFDENLPKLQDWELVIRLSKIYAFNYIDEALLANYFTADSISTNNHGSNRALQLIFEKHIESFSKENNIFSKHSFSVGAWLCSEGEYILGKNYIQKSFIADPSNMKALAGIILSCFGNTICSSLMKKIRNRRFVERSTRIQ